MRYLFNWNNPENDNEGLRDFLIQVIGTDWVKTAEIKKINDNTTKVSTEINSLLIQLVDKESKAFFNYADRTYNMLAIKEEDKLNIYETSKSYWMEQQVGNFSNYKKDTFDPKNRYVGIRLQQGVPLLDRDWNELEDIRRYEELILREKYIGNGTPDDGFRISATDPPSNNFRISAGRCLVDGFEAVNEPLHFAPLFSMEDSKIEEALNKVEGKIPDNTLKEMFRTERASLSDDATLEKENEDKWVIKDSENTFIIRKEENKLNVYPVNFIHYLQQKSVDEKLPDLTQADDTVYLDVWIEEVTSKEDTDLKNQDINDIETCVRHELNWRVRVAENGNGHYPEDYHYHYDIAKIEKGKNAISNTDIKDDRRTGLALHLLKDATAVVTQLTNNSIADTLHRHCKLVASDGSPDPALSVDEAGNVGIGTEKPLNPLGIRASGTSEELISFEDLTGNTKWHINQNLDGNKPGLNFVETGVADGRLFIEKGGNVGIGTASPSAKLHVQSDDDNAQVNIWSFGAAKDAVLMFGTATVGENFYLTLDEDDHRKFKMGPGVADNKLVIKQNGNVGIRTTNPTSYLSIKGNFSMNANNRLEDTASISLDGKHPGLKFHHNTTEEENAWLFLAYNNSFVLYQNNNTGVSWTAPLTILNNGNVGIGKIPDDAKLHIAGNLKLDIGEGLELLGDNDYFETNLDARIFRMIDNNGIEGNVDGGIAIEGFTPTDNARKQIMSIRGNGNVGIGKTNPESKLHVDATNRPTIMAQGNYGGLISGAGGGHGVFGTNIFIDSESQLRTAGTHTHRGGYGYSGMHTTWGNINFYALSNSNTIADAAIEPTSRLFIRGSDGHVGIGKDDPDEKLDVDGNICIRGSYTHLIGGKREGGGVTAIHTHWIKYGESEALGFQKRELKGHKPVLRIVIGGDWTINSKIKSFLINHPLDPEHKELIHSTLEGPEIGVFYRGESQLSNGEATVLLPDYFEALTRKENRTVLLTPKFKEDAQVSMLAASGVKDGKFTVRMIDRKNPSQRFYWEVKAVRADVEILRVEQMKT